MHLRCDARAAHAARTLWPAAQVLRTLKVGPYTRGLAYDPEGEYIAAVSAEGCLQVWHTSGKAELRLPRTAPKARAPAHAPAPRSLPCAAREAGRRVQVDTASAARSAPAWNPDGSLLAVPGRDNDVTLFERLSWEPVFSLAGQHSAPVNAVSFSPDGACCAPNLPGRYSTAPCGWAEVTRAAGSHLVTAGQDCRLLLWDVRQRRLAAARTVPHTVSGMAWQADANALACITESGGVVVWEGVLPEEVRATGGAPGQSVAGSDGARAGPIAWGVRLCSPEAATLSSSGRADGRASSLLDASKDGEDLERDVTAEGAAKPAKRVACRAGAAGQPGPQPWPLPQCAIQPGATPAGARAPAVVYACPGCLRPPPERLFARLAQATTSGAGWHSACWAASAAGWRRATASSRWPSTMPRATSACRCSATFATSARPLWGQR